MVPIKAFYYFDSPIIGTAHVKECMNISRAVGSPTSSATLEVPLDDFDVDDNLTPPDLSGTPRTAIKLEGMNLGFVVRILPRGPTGCNSWTSRMLMA